ncbi:MAG: TolC family protein, partial [Burkholderiales bacterium]
MPMRPTHARSARRAAALAVTALVASLAQAQTTSPLPPPPLSPPAAGTAPVASAVPSAVADAESTCAAQPPAGPLTFAAAQARLARCNRELRGAVRSVAAQRADVITAGQRPNPTFSGGIGNVNPQLGVGSGNPLDLQIDYVARLDQTFERGNKRELRVEAAGRALQAARLSAAEVLRQQQLALAQAWVDLWGAQQRVALQGELIALVGRTLDGAQRRLKAGDVAAADVARIELDVRRAEAE